jgi:hypothetical protein
VLRLRSLIRALGEEEGIGRADSFPLPELQFPAAVSMRFPPDPKRDAADSAGLLAVLKERVREAAAANRVFRQGRVYCFQCESPDCAHSRPEEPSDTFVGYSPTGKPTWASFLGLLLQAGDPRAERLFEERPEIATLVLRSEDLQGDLLPSFGRGRVQFNVLGQVVAGLFPADLLSWRNPSARAALTVQLLETRGAAGLQRLRVNVLGLGAEAIVQAAADGPPRGPAEALRGALARVRERLDGMAHKLVLLERSGRGLDLACEAEPLLVHLCGDIERIFRGASFRTQHAVVRHVEGERPTSFALADARSVSMDRLMQDTRERTMVVLGPKARAHVFTPQGRHVTSMQLEPGEVERKTLKGRWRPVGREQTEQFRDAVRSQERQGTLREPPP